MMRRRDRSSGSCTATRASASTSSPSTRPKSELSDLGKEFAKRYQAKFNEPPVYAALNGFANAIVFAEAIKKANSTEPKAMIKALEEGSFTGWSTTPSRSRARRVRCGTTGRRR